LRRSVRDIAIKVRVRSAKFLQRLLLGPIGGQIPLPRWYARSLMERLSDPTILSHVTDTWLRTPATVERYDFPTDFPPYFCRRKAFDDRYAYRLRDVIVSPHNGVVWLPGGPLLEESYGSLIRSLGWGDIRSDLLAQPRPCSESVIPFPDTGYYHWLLEVLPAALFCLSVAPNSRLLLSDRAHAYVTQAAKMLAPGRVIRATGVRRVKECIVAAIDPFSGYVQKAEIDRLRSSFPRGQRDRNWPTSVYVSRRKARSRSPLNEMEIESVMHRQGLTVMHMEDLSFGDQIALFSSVELLVAPHGAGLANLVWADRIRRVIEIFPASYFNDCYARLSLLLGAEYRYVISESGPKGDGIVPLEAVTAALVG
jgi:hypothetical protein